MSLLPDPRRIHPVDQQGSGSRVFYAKFQRNDATHHRYPYTLCLGLENGFQIWGIDSSDSYTCLLASLMEGFGSVIFVEWIAKQSRLVIIETKPLCKDETMSTVSLWEGSLRDDNIYHPLKTIPLPMAPLGAKSNGEMLAIAYREPARITVLSLSTLEQLCEFDDVATSLSSPTLPSNVVFDIGKRYIAYGSTLTPQTIFTDPDSWTKFAKEATKDVVGYVWTKARSMSGGMLEKDDGSSVDETDSQAKPDPASGVVCIRALIPKNDFPIVSVFKPHSNPLSYLSFSPSGTYLISASTQGLTFFIWSLPIVIQQQVPQLVFKLERGYTSAYVTDIAWDTFGRFVAVSTSHGTSHVYYLLGSDFMNESTELILPPWVDSTSSTISALPASNAVQILYPSIRIRPPSLSSLNLSSMENYKLVTAFLYSPPNLLSRHDLEQSSHSEDRREAKEEDDVSPQSYPPCKAGLVLERAKFMLLDSNSRTLSLHYIDTTIQKPLVVNAPPQTLASLSNSSNVSPSKDRIGHYGVWNMLSDLGTSFYQQYYHGATSTQTQHENQVLMALNSPKTEIRGINVLQWDLSRVPGNGNQWNLSSATMDFVEE